MDQLARYGAIAFGALLLVKLCWLAWMSRKGGWPDPDDNDYSGWGV